MLDITIPTGKNTGKTYRETFAASWIENFETGCWEWVGRVYRNGYGKFYFQGKDLLAHRVAFTDFYHRPPNGVVMHVCDNPLCVNPQHLHDGTTQENVTDKVLKGRGKTKLTKEDVIKIRELHSKGVTQVELGEMYNTTQTNVSQIILGNTWKHAFASSVKRTATIEDSIKEQVAHCCLGISAESGEVLNELRKSLYAGHPLERDKISDEIGDLFFYIQWLCNLLDFDIEKICEGNIKKLLKRYPDGFSTEASINRVPEAEELK